MKRKLVLLLLLAVVAIIWSETINVPADYITIQGAIDTTIDGDSIIVSPGTYVENIIIVDKAITVASLFYTTQDTSYISQTIIDGNQNGSTVTFSGVIEQNTVLTGFTITNGFSEVNGGGIFADYNCSPTLNHLKITANHAEWSGGGYYLGDNSISTLENLLVSENTAYNGAGGAYGYYCDQIMEDSVIRDNNSTASGGGIYCEDSEISFVNVVLENNTGTIGGAIFQSAGEISLVNVTIQYNQAAYGGGIYSWSQLYLENVNIIENRAFQYGGGIYYYAHSLEFCEEIEGRCSIYSNVSDYGIGSDIYSPYSQEAILNTFSVLYPTDYYAAPAENFTFSIDNWLITQIDEDLYVSASGSNENNGLSEETPFQTIRHACAVLTVSEENPHTIFLDSGTYSASGTGESFPIGLPDNTFLCGKDRESVILDAEGNSQVMILWFMDNVTVRGLTLTNGLGDYGGGLLCQGATANLEDLVISGNAATCHGGGLYLSNCSAILNNVLIYGNSAINKGGGICSTYNGSFFLQNVTVCNNIAGENGGGLVFTTVQPKIINSIFADNTPNAICCYSSGILNIAYSDISGGEGEIVPNNGQINLLAGIIYDVPQFVDAGNGDFRLAEDSPCIDMGTAYFEYEDQVWIELQENEYWGDAPDMGAYEYVSISFGDIDDNGLVESYDASLVLMSVVGIDALEEDPLPWEEWRWLRADIDLDGEIGAIDGAYILQYVVGIIGELPVYNSNRAAQNLLTLANDEKYIYLSSDEPVIGLSYKILGNSNVKLGKAEVFAENCLHYQNGSAFAMASAEGVAGKILRLAYDIKDSSQGSVQIELSCNGYREVIDYYLNDGIQGSADFCSIYPNPFNPETTIAFSLPEDSEVELGVYNLKGQRIRELKIIDERLKIKEVVWDGRNDSGSQVASGVYLVRLQAGNDISMRKIVMMK